MLADCVTGSSWFFHPCDGRGQSGIDRSGSFADVGSPPPPSAVRGGCQSRKSNCEASRSRGARIEKFAPARKSQGRANAVYLPDVREFLAEFIGILIEHRKPRHSEVNSTPTL